MQQWGTGGRGGRGAKESFIFNHKTTPFCQENAKRNVKGIVVGLNKFADNSWTIVAAEGRK